MSTQTNYYRRSTTPDEQSIYNHLLGCAAAETPDELIARFYALFIDGMGYPDREIVAALDSVLNSPDVEEYFHYILNRSCHILINRWQSHSQTQRAIPTLIQLLEASPRNRIMEVSRGRAIRRLHHVVQDFLDTEHYLALRRLARVIEARYPQAADMQAESKPLGMLINRYPYLYEHCLLTEDSDLEQQRHVRKMQAEAQHKFEIDLSHYVNYRVRRARLSRQGNELSLKNLRPINNPTLLSDRELVTSLKQFSTSAPNGQSYRDVAKRFNAHRQQQQSYRDFKADLYDYITSDIDPNYGRRQFNKLLDSHLRTTLADSDDKPVNDFLMVRTCSQLFNFMVVDTAAGGQHFVFIDLINNLGPRCTTGLLLRILLICRKVKPYLERRFSDLFNHYETSTRDTVAWLVEVLENLNIALSLNFGSLDLSHITTP